MSIAMVLGNGESRQAVNVSAFKEDYTLIGCNAIHRDYAVDVLICCDKKMAEEAIQSENTKNTKILVRDTWYRYFRKIRKDKRIEEVPLLPYEGDNKADKPIHWGSGPYAVLHAAYSFDTVLLVGFDLYSTNNKVNNIYKGTTNYSNPESDPVNPKFWIYQLSKIFKYFPNTDFLIWNKLGWEMPEEWRLSNVRFEKIS